MIARRTPTPTRDVVRRRAEAGLQVVRAEHDGDSVERLVALQAGQQIGRAVQPEPLDRIGMHGRAAGQSFGDHVVQSAAEPRWPGRRASVRPAS